MMKKKTGLFTRKTAIAAALGVASAPSFAQLVLEEVVVTATKRESTVQDVASTVNVVSGDTMDKFSVLTFSEIENQTAGLTLATPNARNSNIAMRGVAIDPEAGTQSTVDVYWNDMIVRSDIAFSQLYDLERVEVMRGPQGTLQGKTSPGGAINIITRKPDLAESDGFVQITGSDNNGLNTQAAWGGPIVKDVFGLRIAGVYDQSNYTNVENITTGLDEPELEATSARIGALWRITENLSAELTYQYFDRDTDDPRPVAGTDILNERPTLKASDKIALGKTNNQSEFDYDIANLQLSWEIGDHELTSITGYNESSKSYRDENDRANYFGVPDAPTTQTSITDVESIAQEFRFASLDNDFWDYMVGAYYQDQETDTTFAKNTGVRLAPGLEFVVESTGAIPVDAKQWSVFTFNSLYLTDDVTMEVGLRYADYDSSRRADVYLGGFPYFSAGIPDGLAQQIKDGTAARFPIEGINADNENTTEDAVTGNLTLRWDWTENTSLYAGYNRGYRPSGISINPDPAIALFPNGQDDVKHDSETSDSIEVGFKSRLLDGRAKLNGALYYQTFDGYLGFIRGLQLEDQDTGAISDLSGGVIYNGDAEVWGVELEGEILLTETWNLGGAMSYNNATWSDTEAPCNVREPGEVFGYCDVDGDNVGGEPEWSVSINSEYYYPLESTEIYIRGLYKYTGERDNIDASAGIGAVLDQFDANNTVNLYTGWRSSDYSWDVTLWAKNLLDSDEIVYQQGPDSYDLTVNPEGSYTQPDVQPERVVGITARYNF